MGNREAAALGVAVAGFGLIAGGPVLSLWMMSLPPITTTCGVGCTQSHESPSEQPWVGFVLVLIGMVLVVVAWRIDRRAGAPPRRGWRALRSWGGPLIWLAVIPLIAGPAGYLIAASNAYDRSCHVWTGMFSGGSECPPQVYLPSVVLPGLLYLVPVWWLFRASAGRKRLAALVASLLGLAGLAVSILVLFSLGPKVSWDFGFLLPTLPPQQLADGGFAAVLWMAAIIALLVIAKLPDRVVSQGLISSSPG